MDNNQFPDCGGCTDPGPLGGTHGYNTRQHGPQPQAENQPAMTANPPVVTENGVTRETVPANTEKMEENQHITSDTPKETIYQEMAKADTENNGATSSVLPGQKKQIDNPNLNAGNDTTGIIKFDTPELRTQFLEAYIKHISEGYSDDSFRFKGSGIKLFRTYCERFPEEFPSDMREDAQAERLKFWERMGMQGTMGIPVKYKDSTGKEHEAKGKFDGKSWQFNMQNRFKWRNQTDVTSDGEKLEAPMVFIPDETDD